MEEESACWVVDLDDTAREKAVASCEPAHWINDDVVKASLDILASRLPRLRALIPLEVFSGTCDTVDRALRRMLPPE